MTQLRKGGFHFGRWVSDGFSKWCGRCGMETPRHTHLNSRSTDAEARLQVIYTGLP